jgi:hypothetical protein
LELKTGQKEISFKQLKPSRKYTKKPRFLPFHVDPHKVTPALYSKTENLPTVIPIGDAQLDPDYRIGIGIMSGIARVNALLSSVRIDGGNIASINEKQYEALLASPILRHETDIKELYHARRSHFFKSNKEEKSRYAEALKLSDDEKEKQQIQVGINEMNYKIAMNLYKTALEKYQMACKDGKNLILNEYGNISHEVPLFESKNLLDQAMITIPDERKESKQEISQSLLRMAENYKKLAKKYFSEQRFSDCEIYFKLSLEIYSKHFPIQHMQEIVTLHSNLEISENRKNNFDEAIQSANQALQLMPQVMMDEKEKLHDKIRFSKLSALLGKIIVITDVSRAKDYLKQAVSLAEDLKASTNISPLEKSKLEKKFGECEEKIKRLEEIQSVSPANTPSNNLNAA